MSRVRIRAARLVPLVGLMLIAAAWQASPVSATTSTCIGKCDLGMLSSASGVLTFTLTNEASTQSLGSADLTAPSGVVISQPGTVATTGFTNTSATAGVTSNTSAGATTYTLVLRNLSIPPGDSVTVRFAGCGTATSAAWSLIVKQANNFNGNPGNDFVNDGGPPSAAISACALSFVDQPANAVVNTPITSMGFQAGSPVEVKAQDNAGDPIAGVSVAVSLDSPGGVTASLGGTTSAVTAANGLAAFASLTVNAPGYFKLTAAASGFTSIDSSVFLIAQDAQQCGAGSCSSPRLSTKSTAATVTAINQPAGDFLSLGLGGYTYSCQNTLQGGYTSVSDPVGFDVWKSDGVTFDEVVSSEVTIDISKQAVMISPNNGAPFYQICYASNVQFPTRTGTTPGVTTIPGTTTPFYFGLLPDCGSTTPAPCVVSRHKGSAGDVLITFLAAPGDIWGRS